MRFVTPLAYATAVSAIAIFKHSPDFVKDRVHNVESLLEGLQKHVIASVDDGADSMRSEVVNARHDVVPNDDQDSVASYEIGSQDYDLSNYTIYDIITLSNKTTKFLELVEGHDSVVKLLNDTEGEYTLFVPGDKAFEKIPDHKKPSDEFIENLLLYHIGVGIYPAGRIVSTHTLPTALDEARLGPNPQRLRASFGLSGIHINLYSKVIVANIKAKNGYIHAVNHILVPPPAVGPVLALFPSQFSTLLLAYERTEFVKYVHGLTMFGSTVFAPSNKAWERLGPAANAFLFNTEEGKKHLTALLKYQIVPNITVYSDAIYDESKNERMAIEEVVSKDGHFHIQLPTLLSKDLSVDFYKWKLWTSIVVNGAVKVGFPDGVAKNGVIQVVEDIVVPHGKAGERWGPNGIEVEELKRRLSAYVDSNEGKMKEQIGEL